MKLPEEVLNVAYKHGIFGRVYIPKPRKKSSMMVEETFAWFNYVYSIFGATYTEKRFKKSDKLVRNLRVNLLKKFSKKTVISIIKRASELWKKWYSSTELPIIKSIEDLSVFSQVPFINLYKFYLSCRTAKLLNNPMPKIKPNELQQVYQKVAELANKSINSLPPYALDINKYNTAPFVYHKKPEKEES
jgi:hypothetical protein